MLYYDMNTHTPLAKDKKLTVVFRVESGCLGPEGDDHIEEFCDFAQKEIESIESDIVQWEIIPRRDKSHPEMEYKISSKKLSHEKAIKYLDAFQKNLDEFETNLHEELTRLIEQYFGR